LAWQTKNYLGLQKIPCQLKVSTQAFSALTLLVGHEEEHPACKKFVMWCWCGYLSGVRCRWFAYGPAGVTATPSSLALSKSRIVLPFWYRLTQVVLEKRLLNKSVLKV